MLSLQDKTNAMKKRDFIKLTGLASAGLIIAPLASCSEAAAPEASNKENEPLESTPQTAFVLPQLPFAYNALAPKIDTMTMEIHHGKHHAGYVRKLNAAIEASPSFAGMSIEGILAKVEADDTGVRNNGGGHYNHSMFWKILTPGGASAPEGVLAEAIVGSFGSYEAFAEQFVAAAKTRFGSGWAWLNLDASNKLFISSTPNQDNPLMVNIVEATGTPILGIDVWEHAYYLNYQNKRGDYISSFMELINWNVVQENMMAAMK